MCSFVSKPYVAQLAWCTLVSPLHTLRTPENYKLNPEPCSTSLHICRYTTENGMQLIGTVSIDISLEGDWDIDDYVLTAELQFGEALITVRVVDEQTGAEKKTVVRYDSVEVGGEVDCC